MDNLSIAVASRANENEIICAACKNQLAWVFEFQGSRIVFIPRSYELTADGVWQSPRGVRAGRPKPIRKPAVSPVRVGCRTCGSVQFIYPENFRAGIADQTIEEAREQANP